MCSFSYREASGNLPPLLKFFFHQITGKINQTTIQQEKTHTLLLCHKMSQQANNPLQHLGIDSIRRLQIVSKDKCLFLQRIFNFYLLFESLY
jgi:hypothetical protein